MESITEHVRGASDRPLHLIGSSDLDAYAKKLSAASDALGYFFAFIDGRTIHGAAELLEYVETVFRFPEEYKDKHTDWPNWDGTRDRLSDLEWLFEESTGGKTYRGCIVYYLSPLFQTAEDVYDFMLFSSILDDVAQGYQSGYWKEHTVPFHVFFGWVDPRALNILQKMSLQEHLCWHDL